MSPRLQLTAVLLLLSLAPATALADKLTVDQNDPNCSDVTGDPYCTIGAALAAAGPGDTVVVKPGTYHEANLLIGQPNVALKGRDRPVINGDGAVGAAIVIESDGVRVRGFEITNVQTGISAPSGNEGLRIRDNTIHDTARGIELVGSTASTVRDNEIDGPGGSWGIRSVGGADNVLVSNTVRGHGGDGFLIDDERDQLIGNTAEANDDGFSIRGNDNTLKRNVASQNNDDGFDIDGDGNLLRRNEATLNDDRGVDVDGDENELRKNVARQNANDGFDVSGDSNLLRRNESIMNAGRGFDVAGSDNDFRRNAADQNENDGFRTTGQSSGNEFRRNSSTANARDGWDIPRLFQHSPEQ